MGLSSLTDDQVVELFICSVWPSGLCGAWGVKWRRVGGVRAVSPELSAAPSPPVAPGLVHCSAATTCCSALGASAQLISSLF